VGRVLVYSGVLNGVDDETFGPNDLLTNYPVEGKIALTEMDVPQNGQPVSKGWGGECRLEFFLDARLLNDGQVAVNVTGKLFEGTSETTQDLEDEETVSIVVPRFGQGMITMPFEMRLASNEFTGNDTGRINLTFANHPIED
jgi:hypothetical protein